MRITPTEQDFGEVEVAAAGVHIIDKDRLKDMVDSSAGTCRYSANVSCLRRRDVERKERGGCLVPGYAGFELMRPKERLFLLSTSRLFLEGAYDPKVALLNRLGGVF